MFILRAAASLVAALSFWAPGFATAAQGATGIFRVDIDLRTQTGGSPLPPQPAGGGTVCVSESLSQATGAMVTVVCSNGQFVNISPRPGSVFTGTHGGAYRYNLAPGATLAWAQDGDLAWGAGSVTTFRVLRQSEDDSLIELWVQF